MNKKHETNQIALLIAAIKLQCTAVNEVERIAAMEDVFWRSRDLSVTDIARATMLATTWMEREGSRYQKYIK